MLDAHHEFWQLALDEQSSKLTTMATPLGRFRWERLPFVVSPAPEIVQQKLDECISGLDGVKAIADDILMIFWWQRKERHLNKLSKIKITV